jgi:hypothetical protein
VVYVVFVGFEVFTSVLTKSIIFCDMTPCSPLSFNRRFGGTYRLQLQGQRNKFSKNQQSKQVVYVSCLVLVLLSGDRDYIGPNWVGFYLRMQTESSPRNVALNKKNRTMDNVQKVNSIIYHHHKLLDMGEFCIWPDTRITAVCIKRRSVHVMHVYLPFPCMCCDCLSILSICTTYVLLRKKQWWSVVWCSSDLKSV